MYGIYPACLVGTSHLQQGTSVDVLHHVLIDRLDELAGSLFPEDDIFVIVAQQHVGTHIEQGMLTAQLAAYLARSVSLNLQQCLLTLVQLLLGGIVPPL